MATNKNFDIDDMSAFDDFNIDAMDADTPKGKISQSRKIVSTLFKDTAIGTSKGIRRALKNEFTETASQFDDLAQAYSDTKNAVGEIKDAFHPVFNSVKKITLGFMPMVKNLMPKSWYNKAHDYIESHIAEEEETPEQREARQRQEQISASLQDIFKNQKIATETDLAYRTAETLSSNRKFKYQQMADRAMVSGLKQIVAYFHGPTTGYMKKSLELQYQHLFIVKDMYRATANIGNILNAKLEEIKHNTSLPETVKVDALKHGTKRGFIGRMASKTLGGLMSTMITTGKSKIIEALKNAGTMAEMMEGAAANAEMMSPFSLLTATSSLLGLGANWFAGKAFGDKLRSASNTVKDLDQGATGWLGKIKRAFLNKAKQGRRGDGGLLGSIMSFLIPEETKTKTIENEDVTDPTKAIAYDVSSKMALTKVIPKHLERIGDIVEAAFSTQQKFVKAWARYTVPDRDKNKHLQSYLRSDIEHKEYNAFEEKLTSHQDVLNSVRNRSYASDKEIGKQVSSIMSTTRTLVFNGVGKRVELKDEDSYKGENFEVQYASFIKNLAGSRNSLDIYEIEDLYYKFCRKDDERWTPSTWEREAFADISRYNEKRIINYLYAATHYASGKQDNYSIEMLVQQTERLIEAVNPINALTIAKNLGVDISGMKEGKRNADGSIEVTNQIGADVKYFKEDARREVQSIIDRKKSFEERAKKFEEWLENAPLDKSEKDRIRAYNEDPVSQILAMTSGRWGVDLVETSKNKMGEAGEAVKKLAQVTEDSINRARGADKTFIHLVKIVREDLPKSGPTESILYFGMFKESIKSVLEGKDGKISENRQAFISNNFKPVKKDGKSEQDFPVQVVNGDCVITIKDTKRASSPTQLPDFKDVQNAYESNVTNEFKNCLTEELWDELCKRQNDKCLISKNLAVTVETSDSDDSDKDIRAVSMAKLRDPNSKVPNVDVIRNPRIKGPVVDEKARAEFIKRDLASRMVTSDTRVTEHSIPTNVDAKSDKAVQKYVDRLNKRNEDENISYSYDKEKGKIIKTEKAADGEKFQIEVTEVTQLPPEEQAKLLKAATEYATLTNDEDIKKYQKEQEEEQKKYLGLSEKAYSLLEKIFKDSGKDEAQIRKDIEYIVSKPSGFRERLETLLGGHLGVNRRSIDSFERSAKQLDEQYQITREDDVKIEERLQKIRDKYKTKVDVDKNVKDRRAYVEKLNKEAADKFLNGEEDGNYEYILDDKNQVFRVNRAELKRRDEAFEHWSKQTGREIKSDRALAEELVRQDKISSKDADLIASAKESANTARQTRKSDFAAIQDLLLNLFGDEEEEVKEEGKKKKKKKKIASQVMQAILKTGNRKAQDVKASIKSKKNRTVKDKYEGNDLLEYYETGTVRSDEEKERDRDRAVAEATNEAYEKTTPGKADAALFKRDQKRKRQRSLNEYRRLRTVDKSDSKDKLTADAVNSAAREDYISEEHGRKLIEAYVDLYNKYIDLGLTEEEADKKAFGVALSKDGQGAFKSRFGELMTTFNAKRAKRMATKIKDGEYEQSLDAVLQKLDVIIARLGTVNGMSLSSILGDIAAGTKDVVSKGISFTLNGGKKIFDKVVTSGQAAFEYLKDKVGNIASNIGDVAAQAISTMSNFVSSAKDKVKSAATTTIEKAKEMWGKGEVWISGKWEDAKKYGIDKWEQAKECAEGLWEKFTSKKDTAIDYVKEKYTTAKNWVDKKIESGKKFLFGDKTADADEKRVNELFEKYKAEGMEENAAYDKAIDDATAEARTGAIDKVKEKAKKTWSDVKNKFTKTKIMSKIHNFTKIIKVPDYVDIYLKDNVVPGKPLLSKKKQEDGVYFQDSKRVEHSYDINKPVFDSDKQTLISEEDIKTGLVDVDNKPISAGIVNTIVDKVKEWTSGGLLKNIISEAKDAWSWLTGKAKSGAEKTTSFFKKMFGIGGEDFAEYHNNVLLKLDTIIGAIKGTSDKPKPQESYDDSIEKRDPDDAYYQYQQMLQDQEPGEFDSRTGERRKKTRFNSFFGKLGKGIKGLSKLGWKGLKLGAKLGWKGTKLAGKSYWRYLKAVGKGYWKLGKLGIKGVGLLGTGLSYLASDDDTKTDTKASQKHKQNNELANKIDEAFSTKEKRQELTNQLEDDLEKIPTLKKLPKDKRDTLYSKTNRVIELLKTTDLTPSQIKKMVDEEYQGGFKGILSRVKNRAESIFKFDKKKEEVSKENEKKKDREDSSDKGKDNEKTESKKTEFNSAIGTAFKKLNKKTQERGIKIISDTKKKLSDKLSGLDIKKLKKDNSELWQKAVKQFDKGFNKLKEGQRKEDRILLDYFKEQIGHTKMAEDLFVDMLNELKTQTSTGQQQLKNDETQTKLQEEQKKLQEEANKKIIDADGDGHSDGSLADQKATKERQDAARKAKLAEFEKIKNSKAKKSDTASAAAALTGGAVANESMLGDLFSKIGDKIGDKFKGVKDMLVDKLDKKFPGVKEWTSVDGIKGKLFGTEGKKASKEAVNAKFKELRKQGLTVAEAKKKAQELADEDANKGLVDKGADKLKEKGKEWLDDQKEKHKKMLNKIKGKAKAKFNKTKRVAKKKIKKAANVAKQKAREYSRKAKHKALEYSGKAKEFAIKSKGKMLEWGTKLKNSSVVQKGLSFAKTAGSAVKGKALGAAKLLGGKASAIGAKLAGSGLGKAIAGGGAKLAASLAGTPVGPIIGIAAAAAAMGYGAFKGAKKAKENWGLRKDQKASANQKVSSAIAGAITFGFGGKRATKAVDAVRGFLGHKNMVRAIMGNRGTMEPEDVEKFRKKCLNRINKGQKQYERILTRFNKAVAEDDWPTARAISGNEVNIAKELLLANPVIAPMVNTLKFLFGNKDKQAMTQKQIDAFTKKMQKRINKGDKIAMRALSKFRDAVAEENWPLARSISGKKTESLMTKLGKKVLRLPAIGLIGDIFGPNPNNKPMTEKEIKAATERFDKLAPKSKSLRKMAARFKEAVENEDWKLARRLSGNKIEATWKRDLKIMAKPLQLLAKWTGINWLLVGESEDKPLTDAEIEKFTHVMEKRIKRGDKMAQRQLDAFSEAVAQQQWKRARKISGFKVKEGALKRGIKKAFSFFFGSTDKALDEKEIQKFRDSMERKIQLGGSAGKTAERKLDAFNDAVELENWNKARAISKLKDDGIIKGSVKAIARGFDYLFIGSRNTEMSEQEIKEARSKLQDEVTKGAKDAQKKLDLFEDAVADENWRKARLIAKVKSKSAIKRMAENVSNWWSGDSQEMTELEIQKVTSDLNKQIQKGGKEGDAAQKKLEMFERAVEQKLWKKARQISGMKGEGFLSRSRTKINSAIKFLTFGMFGYKKKGEYNIQDCDDIRKDLQEKVEDSDNPQIWNRVLTRFDQYIQDGSYTAAYNFAKQSLQAGEKELKKIDRETRGIETVEEDLQLANRAKDIENNIRKSREKISMWTSPIQYFKLGRLISKVQDMSAWSSEYFDDIELDLQDIDEEAETTGDKNYSYVDPKQAARLKLARLLKQNLTTFKNENINKFPGLAKAANDLLMKLDVNPLAYTDEQLLEIKKEFDQLRKEREEETDRVKLTSKLWKGVKSVFGGALEIVFAPFKLISKIFKGLWKGGTVLFKGIKKIGSGIGSIVKKLASVIKKPIKLVFGTIKKIGGWFGGVVDAFKQFTFKHPIDSVKRIWNAIKGKSKEKTKFKDASGESLSPSVMANAIKNHKYESAVAYDKHGNIVNAARGDEGSVDIKGVPGGTVVHNHPDGSPITESDKQAARSQKLHAVTVASPNGIQTTTFNSKDGIKTKFRMFGWIKKGWDSLKSGLKAVGSGVVNGAKFVGNTALNGVKAVGKGVKFVAGKAWDGVKAAGGAVANVAKKAMGAVTGMASKLLSPLTEGIYNKIKDMLGLGGGSDEKSEPFKSRSGELRNEENTKFNSWLGNLYNVYKALGSILSIPGRPLTGALKKRPTSSLFSNLQNKLRTTISGKNSILTNKYLLSKIRRSPVFSRIISKYIKSQNKETNTNIKRPIRVTKDDTDNISKKLDTMIKLLKCVIEVTANSGNGTIKNVKDMIDKATVESVSYTNRLVESSRPKQDEIPLKPVEINFKKYTNNTPMAFV